ncbi:methylcrotonoyl-CoA carboxylase beta chain, mitochondrial isoform X3 [Nothobranchius furzeri]|uniref:methylcrotonoyl-CoA carboxylase beta chain, mitochondrial isoform X3 n=1 Tax=Nothobranchius furzeri TaxID=105023 RepID=UPI003904C62E
MHRSIIRFAEQHWQCPARCVSSAVRRRKVLRSAFPVLDQPLLPIQRHVYEANLRHSIACRKKYSELKEKVRKGGGDSGIARHTQRNRKLLVRDRLHLLLDDEDFLELSPFAGLGLPYGDIPSAGCLTGIGRINGLWCLFIANDATVKGGTAYPITVKKQLRAQEIAIQNRLPCVYLVDSGGAFLPLQSEIFPDKNQGGRTFYNEAIMSAMKIPQVAVVCGSCTAGGAYIPTMAEEAVMVHRIGTIFLGGPPLVKAATGEEVTPEELGGARLHADHLVGIVANNGVLSRDAALKGSHFVQLCDQRDVPLLFLQNTAPAAALTLSAAQAEANGNRLKAQGSMMSAVACASVPKITVVIGGCHGADSYAMCGRAFDPNFLFLWPNARVSLTAPGHAASLLPPDEEQQEENLNERLKEESSAFFSSGRMWDDGVVLPQDTRKVLGDSLDIIKQQRYQLSTEKQRSVVLRV